MIRKIVISLVLILTLSITASTVVAQEYPVPENYIWICNGTPIGVWCTRVATGDSYPGFPEGYCIDITLPAYYQDGILYYYYYMIPCTEDIVPEIPNSIFELVDGMEVGEEIDGIPFPWNTIEKQSATSFTLYEDKGDGLIGWRKFEKDEKGNWVKVDGGETQLKVR